MQLIRVKVALLHGSTKGRHKRLHATSAATREGGHFYFSADLEVFALFFP